MHALVVFPGLAQDGRSYPLLKHGRSGAQMGGTQKLNQTLLMTFSSNTCLNWTIQITLG